MPRRPRPINPLDNPITLPGVQTFPNGSYVANPYPTTGAIGGTGSYGAGLPRVNVNPSGDRAYLYTPPPAPSLTPLGKITNAFNQSLNAITRSVSGVGDILNSYRGSRVYPAYSNPITNRVGVQQYSTPAGPPAPVNPNASLLVADRQRERAPLEPTKIRNALFNLMANGSLPNSISVNDLTQYGGTDLVQQYLAAGYKEINGTLVAPGVGANGGPASTTGGGSLADQLRAQGVARPNVVATQITARENERRRMLAEGGGGGNHGNARQQKEYEQQLRAQWAAEDAAYAAQQAAELAAQQAAVTPQTGPQWTNSYGLINFNTGTG